MNMSRMKQQMRHNQSCIQHSLSRMHSLHQPCCHSYCSPCYHEPSDHPYDNDEINYKLKKLKLQNKVLQNELNRKQLHVEERSTKHWRKVSSESEQSLDQYTVSSPQKVLPISSSLKQLPIYSPHKTPTVPQSPPTKSTLPPSEVSQLRTQAMQLLRVIEQDDKLFSHFRNHFMNITDFMYALNNNNYSSILIQFIQFVQEMLSSQVHNTSSPPKQECPLRSCQTYSSVHHHHGTCSTQSPPPLLYPCEQQQMYNNYINKQEEPKQNQVQYSPQSMSRIYRPTPGPAYQSMQPLPRQSSLKQVAMNTTPKQNTFDQSMRDTWGQNRTLNQMRNTFQDGPRPQESSLSKTKPSIHKNVCPHLTKSLKKSQSFKKSVRIGPQVQPREPTYWAEDIAPPRKVHSQSTQMKRILKGQQ